MEEFIMAFKNKKLNPYFKSEPIPEKTNLSVVKVVADNYKDVVLDPTKDVLVKFYAPWCGHCKQFAPIYEELAQKLKDNNNKNLVLAEMDATANEVDGVDIRSYPTIKFYTKRNKNSPIEYKGERNEKDVVTFLEDYSSFFVKLAKKKDL
jgi:protein disulfide isomerase